MGKLRVIAFVGALALMILAGAGLILYMALRGTGSAAQVSAAAALPVADDVQPDDASPLNSAPAPRKPPPRVNRVRRPVATPIPLQMPKEAAAAALDLIRDLRANAADYVNNHHGTLKNNLETLEAAANGVINDDGKDHATSAKLSTALSAALSVTINRADIIANRATETKDAISRSLDLEMKLKDIAAK